MQAIDVVRIDPTTAKPLAALTVLPLAVICIQLALDLDSVLGVAGYSLYKLCFLVPPLVYCRMQGINVRRDVLKLHNWRNCFATALALGGLGVGIFGGAYWLLGDVLLDKAAIVEKISEQFSVNASTVLIVAPITIFLNSLLEECFYRGFTFGLLAKANKPLAYLLPATVFTIQHVMFIYHWVTPLPLAMAVVGLFVFALVLQKLYQRADSIVAPWLVHICGDVAMMGIAMSMLWS